jgi:hypothetical protein
MRAALDAVTKKGSRSQSEEINARLAESFYKDRVLEKAPRIFGLMAAAAALAEQIEARTQGRWNRDAVTLEQLCAGLPKLLRDEALTKVAPLKPEQVEEARRAGEQEADALASRINTLKALPLDVIVDLGSAARGKLLTASWPVVEHRLYDIVYSFGMENV